MFAGISLRAIGLVLFFCFSSTAASTLLVKTDGFRVIGWTVAALVLYLASLYSLALMLRDAPLSLIAPILAALCPLMAIAAGIAILGEAASWARIGVLIAACGLIGVAAKV